MSNRRIAASGFFWNIVQTVGERFFQTVVFFVVARLLAPTAFGLAAMAVAPAAVAAAVMQGASQVVVQDKELRPSFEAAAFWVNMAAGLVLGLLIFFFAGPVSVLVRAPEIQPLMMATACVPIVAAFGAVSQGKMTRRFEFRLLAIRRTVGITLAGLACVLLAWLGYGAWSLVVQSILTAAVMSVAAVFAAPVRMFERFTRAEAGVVAKQSGLLCASTALIQGNTRLSDLVVGYFTGPAGAGAFRLARTIIDLILSFTFTPLANVLLPIFAKANDEPDKVLSMYVKIVVACSLVFSAVEICTIFGAESFRTVFLGNSWPVLGWVLIFLAPLFPTMCISASQPLLIARGRSGPVLAANAIRLVTSTTCLAWGGYMLGVNGAAIGYTVCTYLALFGMILFMRHEIPALRPLLGMRVLIPQVLALIVGLGGYLLALRIGLTPQSIPESVAALSVALIVFAGLCLLLCRREIDITIDVLPTPAPLKTKLRSFLRLPAQRQFS
jgi:PST family polysaccharide transporter